ncbi:ankyrin repeat domain-containing protein [Arthrobacter sp. UM1]|uniref:ankyrin repeat domain-containing protein n=1 Tax=Arthrobacter sp. UM1 TaxID=2766776 RepID=UPI001CF633A1|nr:ankyrin repeat domain-containing protein [Arthrobacter sp. UM1]
MSGDSMHADPNQRPGAQAGAGDTAAEAAPTQPDAMSADHREAVMDLADRLFDAAREGRTEALCAYVDAGAPVNLANATGDSLLMLAAYHGHADTVRALGQRGADPDQMNSRGQAPVAGAVFKGEDEVLEALLELRADPHAGSPSAVETAQFFGKPELAARLEAHAKGGQAGA